MNSSRLFLGTLLVVVISTTYIFVSNAALGPRFKISNNSLHAVVVTAKWRDQVRNLGTVEPNSSTALTVRDEASMVFDVEYADGRELYSESVYFTSGMTIYVSIAEESVAVKQGAGP